MSKKIKKLLTLEQLVQFCEQNKFHNFSSKDTGYTLSVQVPGNLNFSNEEDDDLLYTTVKVCHTLLNRNGSYISEDNMKKNMNTLKYKPLLASIVEDENGELDFNGHDMEFNEDGTINYIEKQIGTFTIDEPYLEYDKEQDKTYVIATAVIPREYSSAASIIEKKNGTKVSCELRINEMEYNVKDGYLELTDFVFSGVCCLGESVAEGMVGSRLDIADFSTENNSIKFEQDNKLVEVLEKLNNALTELNINTSNKEGGKTLVKFEELLKKYNKTIEEITFEYENLTDEELEQKFEEVFGENTEGEGADPEPASEGGEANNETDEDVNVENEEEGKSGNDESQKGESSEEPKASEDEEDIVNEPIAFSVGNKTFAVSLDDMQFAMNALINETYSEQDGCYYSTIVYEDHVVMVDCLSYGKAYRQKYAKRKKRCSLIGERVPVKSYWVTEEEESMIDNMRANYSTIEEQLKEYQLKEENAQKDALFVSEDYSSISNKEEFKALAENHAEFSVDELKAKLDEVLLSYAKRNALEFSVKVPEKKKVNRVSFGMNTEESNTGNEFKPYGDLFD